MVTPTISPRELRRAAWQERFTGLITGLAPGYVQTNLAIVPAADSEAT